MRFRNAIALCFLLALSSCVPKERFWWAPDGESALVLLDGNLHMADSSGTLSEAFAMVHPGAEVTQAAWMPGGSAILAIRTLPFTDWSELKPHLSPSESQRIEELADAMPFLLRAAIIEKGDAKSVGDLLNRVLPAETELTIAALLLANQNHHGNIVEALADAPQAKRSIPKSSETPPFVLYELCLTNPASEEPFADREVLQTTMRTLANPQGSPTQPAVAYAMRDGEGQSVSLCVVTPGTSETTTVAAGVYASYDWTTGGDAIVYAKPAGSIDSVIKTIHKVSLYDEKGKNHGVTPGGQQEARSEPPELATAIIPFLPHIQCLPNEKVLFAAQPGQWPTSGAELPESARLYVLSLTDRSITAVTTREGDLPMNLSHFVPSPDGRQVVVVESDSDVVALVQVATGKTEIIAAPEVDAKCRTLPAWRNNEEISFALPGEAGDIRWVLRAKSGTTTSLSSNWPKRYLSDWLEFPKEKSEETSD